MLWGLLLGNLVDLDHIYYRIIGKAPWFGSACAKLGEQCSFNFYPLHNFYVLVVSLVLSLLILNKNKKIKFIGWLCLGLVVNFFLDYIQLITGVGI